MDQVAATRAVIEAADELCTKYSKMDSNVVYHPAIQYLHDKIIDLHAAENPDLDAKIAEVLPNHVFARAQDSFYIRSAVRDMIVALLVEDRRNASVYLDEMADPYQRAVKVGYDQAREQAAKIADNCCMEYAQGIRAMEPQK